MNHERWHKKDVGLTWNMRRTTFGAAQELFSSHDVDVGSKLLLRSLDITSLPEHGHAIDFGCGYGVLGLALLEELPGWTVDLIDRDALAVAFSRWNAERLGFDDRSVACAAGLGLDTAPESGCDLILWNVPGKAGEAVLARLTGDVASGLGDGGMVALVVVNPLSGVIRLALEADPAMTVIHIETHAEHTVIHARREGRGTPRGDPFERGVFDRERVEFGVDHFEYDLTPVTGLPEYDAYSFATEVAFDVLRTIDGLVDSVLVMRPGQGHVPLVVAHQFTPDRLVLIDRDQLALRASRRALVDAGQHIPKVTIVAGPDLAEAAGHGPFSLAVLMFEEQVRNDIHVARLEDLGSLMAVGGNVIAGGSSSVVSRFLSFAAKTEGWKVRERVKRSGASAARLERVA